MPTNLLVGGGAVLIILLAATPGCVLLWRQRPTRRVSPREPSTKLIVRQVEDALIAHAATAWVRGHRRPAEAEGLVARKLRLGLRLTEAQKYRRSRRHKWLPW
jgi:hypothetical protein